ncbi:hypothetical protein D3C77_670480 [compost metagenome]
MYACAHQNLTELFIAYRLSKVDTAQFVLGIGEFLFSRAIVGVLLQQLFEQRNGALLVFGLNLRVEHPDPGASWLQQV